MAINQLLKRMRDLSHVTVRGLVTLRQVRSGAYRVNFRDGNETTAYYTDNLDDAVNTAIEMARERAL